MADHTDLPFKAEYAKSGRSACKGCRETISNNSMRLAVMVKSHFSDGKMPNWFHEHCFWKSARVENTHDIHGFDSLRSEDQQKIKEKLGGRGGGEESGDVGSSESPYDNFSTDYAKSKQSKCRVCEELIAKKEVRISRKDRESVGAKRFGPQEAWYHVDCFVKERDELGFGPEMNVEKIKWFSILKKEDRDMLIQKLGKGEKPKKRKVDDKGDGGGKKQKKETE